MVKSHVRQGAASRYGLMTGMSLRSMGRNCSMSLRVAVMTVYCRGVKRGDVIVFVLFVVILTTLWYAAVFIKIGRRNPFGLRRPVLMQMRRCLSDDELASALDVDAGGKRSLDLDAHHVEYAGVGAVGSVGNDDVADA